MSSIRQVVLGLSDALGKAESTIEDHAIALRQVGILGRTKRGRGARRASFLDGANLLLAVLFEGPESSKKFVGQVGTLKMRAKSPAPVEIGLHAGMQFKDSIAALLSSFATGAIHKVRELDSADGAPAVELHVQQPDLLGVLIFRLKSPVKGVVFRSLKFGSSGTGGKTPTLGVRSDRWLTGRAILTVARILSEGETS